MESVVAYWTNPDSPTFSNLPIREVLDHGIGFGFLDRPMHYVAMDGSEDVIRSVKKIVLRSGGSFHDARALTRELAEEYSPIGEKVGQTFLYCFLRWLVIERLFAGERVIAWDADIFHNVKLSLVEEAMNNLTGTVSSSCFVSLSDQNWLLAYRDQLNALRDDFEAYIGKVTADYKRLSANGSLGGPTDSFFGNLLSNSINSPNGVEKIFLSTPEEIFIDHLIRSGQIPQQLKLQNDTYLICPQFLVLPDLHWVTGHPGDEARLQAPVHLTYSRGTYEANGKDLLFLHFQGAVYRLCAAHLLLRNETPSALPRIKSRLHPGSREGLYAEDVLYKHKKKPSKSPTLLSAFLGKSTKTDLSEAAIAKRYVYNGKLLSVLNDKVSDVEGLWSP